MPSYGLGEAKRPPEGGLCESLFGVDQYQGLLSSRNGSRNRVHLRQRRGHHSSRGHRNNRIQDRSSGAAHSRIHINADLSASNGPTGYILSGLARRVRLPDQIGWPGTRKLSPRSMRRSKRRPNRTVSSYPVLQILGIRTISKRKDSRSGLRKTALRQKASLARSIARFGRPVPFRLVCMPDGARGSGFRY